MPAKKDKPSKVELAKQNSQHLRGTIVETLQSDAVTFEHDDQQALKFHGIYCQDDRDKRQGRDKEHIFMIRTKCPGGRMTAEQYLKQDDLARQYTHNDSLRITTRQGFQYHGVVKGNLKTTIRDLNDALVSTLAGCGDVERNVMISPAPIKDPAHQDATRLGDHLARTLAPRTGAYFEIWLNGEKVKRHEEPVDDPEITDNIASDDPEEPLYGPTYMPRKFKTGIATPDDNSIDVHSQDVGLIPVRRNGTIDAVNILIGGGMGMTHRKADTYARLASQLGSVDPRRASAAVKVILSIQRDFGDRADRRHARLKYTLDDMGLDAFKEEFHRRADFTLHEWVEVGELKLNDYLGPWDQHDGKRFYGVWVQNGRIRDFEGGPQYKTAFRKIVQRFQPTVILTPNQSVLFADLDPEAIEPLEAILAEHDVKRFNELSGIRRYSMACPALPTCGLALSESERYLPDLLDEMEPIFAAYGVEDEPITIRMTGCPNGCARPYTADLAFVGRKPGSYDIYVGGRLSGDRAVTLFAEEIDDSDLTETVKPLIRLWAEQRQPEESLGDFYNRVFEDNAHRVHVTGGKDNPARDRVLEAAGT